MILKASGISPNNVAIDSSQQFIISWRNMGDRSYFYQIQIYLNSDSTLVYDTGKISSLNTFHIVPPNTLIAGNLYKYRIILWNQKNESSVSDWIIIKASTVPIVNFTNISNGSEVLNSSYLFMGEYSNPVSPIRSWIMILYDYNDEIISMSPETFSDKIEYEFAGLHNESNYKIELQVRSQDNLLATTGKIEFYVRYEVPASAINLQAENVNEKAGIRLSWKTTQIIGHVLEGSVLYIDNEKIDLRNGKIAFQDGMSNFRKFHLKLWLDWVDLKNIVTNNIVSTCLGNINWITRDGKSELLRLKSPLGDIWLEWIYENDIQGRFHLWKNFYDIIYHLQTDLMSPIRGDIVYVGVSYDGNLCELYSQIM